MAESLLVELLTEELPPKSLRALSEVFARELVRDLRQDGLLGPASNHRIFATPRRLAVLITDVAEQAPDSEVVVKGPSVKAGLDASGQPTAALRGFARKRAVEVEMLVRISDGKQEVFAHRDFAKGSLLEANLDAKVNAALKQLPVSRVMRWGEGDVQFVRPAHGIVMLHGRKPVSGTILGLKSRNVTLGHRFLSSGALDIPAADQYETILEGKGFVIPSFERRKEVIRDALIQAAGAREQHFDELLLDEVTALVECPAVYTGSFSAEFLNVPHECLILSMKQHQKYFPLTAQDGKLAPKFLMVSNLKTSDPTSIILGNERVLRARLADAKFFYEQDSKTRLETRLPMLAKVIYHHKLGTQLERSERVRKLAGGIANSFGADVQYAERAAMLAKADLVTDMVGEFPELQGVMGRYYALHDGEDSEVAAAIEAHYRPRYAGDRLPEGSVACVLAVSDKLEVLAGMFGIKQQPTGDKDPYGLRRHALGIVRILIEGGFNVSLSDLIADSFEVFPEHMLIDGRSALRIFIFERLRGYLREGGYTSNEIEAVLSSSPEHLHRLPAQLAAVRAFSALPEAESLAAANKRVANILKQAEALGVSFGSATAVLLREPAERELFEALQTASKRAFRLFEQGDYAGYLETFAILKAPVDAFFDTVMVMVDDTALRENRLGLLAQLRSEMNRVADISKLAA